VPATALPTGSSALSDPRPDTLASGLLYPSQSLLSFWIILMPAPSLKKDLFISRSIGPLSNPSFSAGSF